MRNQAPRSSDSQEHTADRGEQQFCNGYPQRPTRPERDPDAWSELRKDCTLIMYENTKFRAVSEKNAVTCVSENADRRKGTDRLDLQVQTC
jgi:hypothetical protein